MPDDETSEALGAILEAINKQNELLPAIIFKVEILWTVLRIVAGVTLVAFLGFLGSLILKGGA